jgi:hypothetical protein
LTEQALSAITESVFDAISCEDSRIANEFYQGWISVRAAKTVWERSDLPAEQTNGKMV